MRFSQWKESAVIGPQGVATRLSLVDLHVLDLLRDELLSSMEIRFGAVPPTIRSTIVLIDDFDALDWLIDRVETDDSLSQFIQRLYETDAGVRYSSIASTE